MRITRAHAYLHMASRRTVNNELEKNLRTISNYMTEKALRAAGMRTTFAYWGGQSIAMMTMVASLTGL